MKEYISLNDGNAIVMVGLTEKEMEFLNDFFEHYECSNFMFNLYSQLKESKRVSNIVIIPMTDGTNLTYIIQKIIS